MPLQEANQEGGREREKEKERKKKKQSSEMDERVNGYSFFLPFATEMNGYPDPVKRRCSCFLSRISLRGANY